MGRHRLTQSVHVDASRAAIWEQVTNLDIASFRHPAYLAILGIPKPLRAEVVAAGVGGARFATFSNGLRFSQRITDWQPNERFGFTFEADPGFRVAYCLDLARGPFRMRSGAYRIEPALAGARLSLMSEYELQGWVGALLRVPVGLVLLLFQAYLLRGIRRNAERREPGAT
jgi:hypothetical protein